MDNLKKVLKDTFIFTLFHLFLFVFVYSYVFFWGIPGFYKALFTGTLAEYLILDEDFGIGILTIIAIPLFLFHNLKNIYELSKLTLDYKKKIILEKIIVFDACTGAIKLDNLSKKEQKSYVNYRGYTQENKKIIISAFPDVFSYKGNMENKKYLVRYFKYSKVAIEIKKLEK